MRVGTVLLSGLWLWPVALATAENIGSSSQRLLFNPLAMQSLDVLSATVTRPLFAPDRKVPAKPVVFVAPVEEIKLSPPPVPNVSLVGTLKDAGGRRVLLKADATDKIARLKIGDLVGGWTIAEIDSRRMVLALEDQTAAVSMFKKGDARSYNGSDTDREQERRQMQRASNMHR